jgi:hypothetical protein
MEIMRASITLYRRFTRNFRTRFMLAGLVRWRGLP